MYEEFFSFAGSPFRLAPDPKFFFGSKSHNKAMAYLHYGLRQAEGFIVITGEIGAGKSILIGHLIDQLDRSSVLAANLVTPNLAPDDLLSHVLSAFRIEAAGIGKAADVEAFEDFLFDQMNHGRRVLLIVDEAQNLPLKTLEELRVLSNLNYDGTPLFQVFLVGQPEFRDTMARADLEQLRQRVIATYHLEPMTCDETEKYIEHRLGCVGWAGNPQITSEAFEAIFAATGGLPRKIHKLCNRMLLFCAVEKIHRIDAAAIKAVLDDMIAEQGEAAAPEAPAIINNLDINGDVEIADIAESAAPTSAEVVTTPSNCQTPAGPAQFEAPVMTGVEQDFSSPQQAEISTPMSVLDRLRRAGGAQAAASSATQSAEMQETVKTPKPATLDDVANAIAAARPGRRTMEELAAENDAAKDESVLHAPLGEIPPLTGEGEGWRNSVVKSINDTRDELKRAHDSVSKLRRQLTEIDRRRRKRRVQIAASLDRAASLLTDFQNTWR